MSAVGSLTADGRGPTLCVGHLEIWLAGYAFVCSSFVPSTMGPRVPFHHISRAVRPMFVLRL